MTTYGFTILHSKKGIPIENEESICCGLEILTNKPHTHDSLVSKIYGETAVPRHHASIGEEYLQAVASKFNVKIAIYTVANFSKSSTSCTGSISNCEIYERLSRNKAKCIGTISLAHFRKDKTFKLILDSTHPKIKNVDIDEEVETLVVTPASGFGRKILTQRNMTFLFGDNDGERDPDDMDENKDYSSEEEKLPQAKPHAIKDSDTPVKKYADPVPQIRPTTTGQSVSEYIRDSIIKMGPQEASNYHRLKRRDESTMHLIHSLPMEYQNAILGTSVKTRERKPARMEESSDEESEELPVGMTSEEYRVIAEELRKAKEKFKRLTTRDNVGDMSKRKAIPNTSSAKPPHPRDKLGSGIVDGFLEDFV